MITQYSYGDNQCASRRNNVIERFKNERAEEIRADLQPNRSDAVLVLENLSYNISIGSCIRAANAFLAKETYVVGRYKIDQRGSVGCNHYEHVYHADTFQEVFQVLNKQGYTLFAIDNIDDGIHEPEEISMARLPPKSAFILGNEGDGLHPSICRLCDELLYIKQLGSVRSLNVAQAAAICLYEYNVCRELCI